MTKQPSNAPHCISEMLPVLDNLPDAVLTQDLSGKISYVNSKFCSLLGYKAEEIIGLSHKEVIDLLLQPELSEYDIIYKNFKEVLKGTSFTKKRKLKHKSGSYIPVQQYLNPIKNHQGQCIGTFFVFKDLHQELLLEINHTINSSLNINNIINTASSAVLEHLGLSSYAIFLYDKKYSELQLIACNLIKKENIKLFKHKLGEGAPGIIAAERRPLYIRDMKTDPLIHAKTKEFMENKSSIGFPLISKGELLGVIAFDAYTVRDFTTQELFLFENIANQMAVAIHNIKLYNITKKLAVTDGLTGLFNHQYFQKCTERELKRAERNSSTLSLLMIDMDYFKQVNDHFGHPEGDIVLKKISKVLKNCVRSTDTICRYGGEEFAVILTDCSTKNAIILSEKIRHAIEILDIGIKDVFKLTSSIGIASYPSHATDKNELIAAADCALYKAKKIRNKICVAKPCSNNKAKMPAT